MLMSKMEWHVPKYKHLPQPSDIIKLKTSYRLQLDKECIAKCKSITDGNLTLTRNIGKSVSKASGNYDYKKGLKPHFVPVPVEIAIAFEKK